MKPKVAAMLIVKASDATEAKSLARVLGSVNGYVDEIFIQLNAPKDVPINQEIRTVAEQFTKEVSIFTWTGNFVAARQDLMDRIPKKYDWLIWLDSDDIVENPENIIPVAAVMPSDVNGVHILYDYQKDEFGNVIVSLWNARMVRNNGSYQWKSSFDDDEVSVHETLVPKRASGAVSNNEWKVVHAAAPEHYKESLLRNIDLLEGMAQRQALKPEGIDPRILYYLGSHYFEAYRFREAKEMFYEYLKTSGWAEERSEAHLYMGKILKMEEKFGMARTAFLQALGEYPKNPGSYLELGKLESKQQRWEQAKDWLAQGIAIKVPLTAMVKYNNDFELFTLYAQACANLGGKHLTDALKYAQKALKLRPFDPDAKTNRDNIEQLIKHRDQLRATSRLLNALNEEDPKRVLPFINALPKTLDDSPLVIQARQEHTPSTTWPKKSIVIYVGQGPLGSWGPWSLNEGGTGGSEEAVVRLSRELTQLGWAVTVFGMPGTKAGIHDGVSWRHYWEINNKDKFDVLISWRQPAFFDYNWKARRKYLWLHDVVPAEELTEERINNVTKVIYVSKYHSERPENAHISRSKKLASGNGITTADFVKYSKQPLRRDSKRCIYMSANERGLRILLDIWPEVRKAVPDATLDVYYGWHSFDAVNRDNPERMAWKATMVQRMKELKGVTERGRIGQDELNQEIFKSGIWAYPCFFPEVNCITAQKAMAGGAVPVVSDYAVLKDVVKHGTVVPMNVFKPEDIELYKNALIAMLKSPKEQEKIRRDMMPWARQTFDWAVTATQWSKEFNK